jgi:hypothetical protein
MAITKVPVTGSVVLPDGNAFTDGVLIFQLSDTDTEASSVLPAGKLSVTLNGADLPANFEIWRNTRGLKGTYYTVTLNATFSTDIGGGQSFTSRKSVGLGTIQVGGASSYTIGQLLGVPVGDAADWTRQVRYFNTRAEFVTWAATNTPEVGTIIFAADLGYRYSGSGTAISDLPGYLPMFQVYPDHWADNTSPGVTNMTTAIQAGLDYLAGGGVLNFKFTLYGISAELTHKRAVRMQGQGCFSNNDYASNANYKGSWISILPDSHCNGLVVRADISDMTSSFPRQHGGMFDMGILGNRTAGASMTATDLNNAGDGILLEGTSHFYMTNVKIALMAGRGVRTQSYDYGDGEGARSVNNLHLYNVQALRNADIGFSMSDGDGSFVGLVAGNNGSHGFQLSGSTSPVVNSAAWDNGGRGFTLSGRAHGLTNCKAYDNNLSGVVCSDTSEALISGCHIYQNGAGLGAAADTSGLVLAGTTTRVTLSGCVIGNSVRTTQTRGVYSTMATGMTLIASGNDVSGNTVADWSITDTTGVLTHGTVPSTYYHPGFTLSGTVNVNDFRLTNARSLSRNAWNSITTITSNTLACAFHDMIVLNVSGGATINDITCSVEGIPTVTIRNSNATAVTITHNTLKLRCNGATNITLAQHQAVQFAYVSGTVWQQV